MQVHKVACYVANVGRLCLMSLSLLFMLLLQIYMPAGVGMDASFFNEKKLGTSAVSPSLLSADAWVCMYVFFFECLFVEKHVVSQSACMK